MSTKALPKSPGEIRPLIRSGEWRGVTAGLAPGHVQANLAILPRELAFDFLVFCQRNPKPCPLLEVLDQGRFEPERAAPGADLRTDLPRYRIFRNGEMVGEEEDIRGLWRDDLVPFLLGCSFSFETALMEAGIPLRHVAEGKKRVYVRHQYRDRSLRRLFRADGSEHAPHPARSGSTGCSGHLALSIGARCARAHRRSGLHRHREHRQARLRRPHDNSRGGNSRILGLWCDSPGCRPQIQAIFYDYTLARSYVHHRLARRRPGGALADDHHRGPCARPDHLSHLSTSLCRGTGAYAEHRGHNSRR